MPHDNTDRLRNVDLGPIAPAFFVLGMALYVLGLTAPQPGDHADPDIRRRRPY
jgi:hypothetical protein